MKRRELMQLGVASMIVVPGAGCATLLNMFQKYIPQLSVQKMSILDMTLTTMKLRFLCNITNPNPIPFKLDSLSYLLRLGGHELAKGSAAKGIALRPRTGGKTDLDIAFGLGETAGAILDLLSKRIVDYELAATGQFFTKETGGIDIPVGFKGKLPVPKLPQLNVKSFNATSVSAQAVGFRVETLVHNLNDFEIPIDGFSLDLKLDGKNVLQNKGVKGLRVAPGKSDTVPMDFRVGLPELGLSLADIAQGRRMNWELGTELRSGKLLVPFKNQGVFRFG